MFFVFILYALFASVFTISKTGLEYTSPLFLVGSRMLVAGSLLLAYQAIIAPSTLRVRKSDIGNLLTLAICNIYLTNALEFWGLQYLPSFKVCFFYSLSPFAAALFSYFLFSETLTKKQWIGLIVGFCGLLPMIFAQTELEQAIGHFLIFSWPELSVLGAAICSVYGWILLKKTVTQSGHSPLIANGYSMTIGGTIAIAHSILTEPWDPLPIAAVAPFMTSALSLIIISNLICYNLYGYLLQRFSATFMSFAGFTTPLFAALFGWFFLNEVITWPFYLGLVGILTGLSIFYHDEVWNGEKKGVIKLNLGG